MNTNAFDRVHLRVALLWTLTVFVLVGDVSTAFAAPPSNKEIRASRLRDLDSHCPMTVPESLESWKARANELKLQLRVSLGMHPMPKLSVQPPVVHGRRDMDGYSIEKVYFESLQGFYVTGSLYRPLVSSADASKQVASKKYPLVLFPHGHWEEGRFYNAKPAEVKELLATGAERFENAAINHMQAQCVQLARMGIIVFQYDMIGYADCQQISLQRAHRFGIAEQDVNQTADGWPFFSPTAEGYLQSIMGLQAINTYQAVSRISELPGVDSSRIAITGASGGGTQSFIAMALDDRLLGAFPAVMVSTGMQGGCSCENACGLRVGTGNVEIAALAAPRSLGMTSANDWTVNMANDGFPELQAVYKLFGKRENVSLFNATQFPHNYNHVSRTVMYGWANKLFQLGLTEPILERDFQLLHKPDLTVWDETHPAPESGPIFERKFLKEWAKQIDDALEGDSSSEVVQGWRTLIQPGVELSKSLRGNKQPRLDRNENDLVVMNEDNQIVGRARLVGSLSDASKSSPIDLRLGRIGVANEKQKPNDAKPYFQLTIEDPVTDDATLVDEQPLVANPRPMAAYTYGYNAPQLVRKLAVLIALSKQIRSAIDMPQRLLAAPDQEFLAYASLLVPENSIQSVEGTGQEGETSLSFRTVDSIRSPYFLPGALRYQDIGGLKNISGAITK